MVLFGMAEAQDEAKWEAFARSHCLECHGGKKVKGKVDLKDYLKLDQLASDLELTKNLIEVLDYEEMPPEDEAQPSKSERSNILGVLERFFDSTLKENRVFAQSPMRRMNRFQYSNAVKDLFELKTMVFSLPERMMRDHSQYFNPSSGKMPETVQVGSRPLGKSQMISESVFQDVAPFPQDLRAEHGFDNRGDHLTLSPMLLESFLELSSRIVDANQFNSRYVGIWDRFFKTPDDKNAVNVLEQRIGRFLQRAFRRPVLSSEIQPYLEFSREKLAAGAHFTEVMKAVAKAVIASPKFLYLYDDTSENASTTEVSSFDLASRLSFFLWGSLPDQTLLDLAAKDELLKYEVLLSQADRMLNDKKLKRFTDSFPTQWLQLERIISSRLDKDEFPFFYKARYRSSMHMMLEPLLLFETVLIENRSVIELLNPSFTYQSDWLANPKGKDKFSVGKIPFKRREIHDRRYGGIITNLAVLTMTSGSKETHPITRGAWLSTVVFNNPPPPPPADVPPLPEKPAAGDENLTLRERLNQHRERSDCAGCHDKIDPLGFALENFDAMGMWRDQYENGRQIDMQGKLFRKHRFDNALEFKKAILKEKDRFVRGLAGHLLSFALARELDASDEPSIEFITAQTISKDYRFREMIKAVVQSTSFRMKTTPAKLVQHLPSKKQR